MPSLWLLDNGVSELVTVELRVLPSTDARYRNGSMATYQTFDNGNHMVADVDPTLYVWLLNSANSCRIR